MKDFNIHEKINIRSHTEPQKANGMCRFELVSSGSILSLLESYDTTIQDLSEEPYNTLLDRKYSNENRHVGKKLLFDLKW